MAVLFLLFATAMGVATFVENDFGTQTAKALIYNAWWFEAIMVFFVLNFFGNIFRYRLYRKEKWAVLLFHVAFLFILIGAGITRYIGFEGIMVIGEGETTHQFLSDTAYLNVVIDNNKEQKTIHEPLLLSSWGSNKVSFNEDFRGQDINFTLADYIPAAEKKMIEDPQGAQYLFFVESSSGSRHEHYIKEGTLQNIHGILIGFNAENENANINFRQKDGTLHMSSKKDGEWLRMADQARGRILKDSLEAFQYLTLHTIEGVQFVIPKPAERGFLKMVRGDKDSKNSDVLLLDIHTGGETERIEVSGGQYNSENTEKATVGDLNFQLLYGSKILETPFSVKLNDFQLEKYPGSESAASYASEVTVISPEKTFSYRIFMNHILDYKGYKLFQSSYSLEGEVEETHLSVNHDYWGTLITYIGYFMLYAGLLLILFVKGTRFDALKKSLRKIRVKKATLSSLLFLLTFGIATAQHGTAHEKSRISDTQIDSILQANLIAPSHADTFNSLVIQDAGGRMKPAHTFASELLRKVSKSTTFHGMQASQVFLSIIENPRLWVEVPVIYLEKGNSKIRETLGIPTTATHARLSDFITPTGAYKIQALVAAAQKKNVQNKFEKDLLKIDKRVGLLYSAIGGGIFRIYPLPNDPNNTWVSQPETLKAGFTGIDSVFVRQSLPVYLQLLQKAKKTNDYTAANKVLGGIQKFQQKFGAAVYPSAKKIEFEIAYNKVQPFVKLAKYYGYVSLLLMLFVIAQIFSTKKWIHYSVRCCLAAAVLLFFAHTTGLGVRWYISGNAPWSNAYESIIYVAWATMLFGLFLGRKSALTVTATTFLTAIILAFAHQNWLDPEIANLQPVLNSWWLLVHVSIIVASYGPFSLAMILGIFSLFLIALTTQKNKATMDIHLKELTIINEMAMTVGLIMLAIGNFLGGMWANESWGRYWGWDPKETWALISIMIYAFVLHMRLIPGLRGRFTFNLWSVLAYSAIMMTYFGVNFYLSGLHSYASGDRVITPNTVFYALGFVIILGTFSWIQYKKHYKK